MTDLEDIMHENKNLKVVTDFGGNFPSQDLDIVGILIEDAERADIEDQPAIRLIAQCGDLHIVACARFNAEVLSLKKGDTVALEGTFQPVSVERMDNDTWRPFSGFMSLRGLKAWRVKGTA